MAANRAEHLTAFDDTVATRCAHEADALIAMTALVHDMIVVTRNVSDFEGIGVVVVDKWQG